MQIKLFEIRDKGTFIPAMGVNCSTSQSLSLIERYLLRSSGYGELDHIILIKLESDAAHNDPYAWGNRTMKVAHVYIRDYWNEIKSGSVIDVEFILKETTVPKESQYKDNRLSQ